MELMVSNIALALMITDHQHIIKVQSLIVASAFVKCKSVECFTPKDFPKLFFSPSLHRLAALQKLRSTC